MIGRRSRPGNGLRSPQAAAQLSAALKLPHCRQMPADAGGRDDIRWQMVLLLISCRSSKIDRGGHRAKRDVLRFDHLEQVSSPGLDPGVHVFLAEAPEEDVGGRVKPGHENQKSSASAHNITNVSPPVSPAQIGYGGRRTSVLMKANEDICKDLLDADLRAAILRLLA